MLQAGWVRSRWNFRRGTPAAGPAGLAISSREEMQILRWLRGGHEPRRMTVIDAVRVDGRRSVILVRRDNVEHLVMVGGPNDLVIESNIMREPALKQSQPPELRAPPPVGTATPSPQPPVTSFQKLAELKRRLESELLRAPPLRGRPSPAPWGQSILRGTPTAQSDVRRKP